MQGDKRKKRGNDGHLTEQLFSIVNSLGSDQDPDGSYTGRPTDDLGERPVQDADDL